MFIDKYYFMSIKYLEETEKVYSFFYFDFVLFEITW